MATNIVKQGDEFDYVNAGANVKSGDVVVLGDVVGIALTDILTGSTGAVLVSGVAIVAKKTSQAWAQGQKVYYDSTGSPAHDYFTTAADDGGSPATAFVFAGWAYDGALSADATATVKFKI